MDGLTLGREGPVGGPALAPALEPELLECLRKIGKGLIASGSAVGVVEPQPA